MSSGNNNPNVNGRKQFAFDLNVVPLDDGNSKFSENSDPCMICLDPLAKTTNDNRVLVALNCNHKFHLDCIGSAFNAKGFMQCPYCMQIEPGNWRNAPNRRQISDFDDDDMIVEDEEGAYTNMAMGVEWCPYGSGQHYFFNTQRCPFIEYSFIFPEPSAAAAAGVDPNSIISEWITSRDVHNVIPLNRRIFWSLTGPGMMTGRHYIAHPSLDHTPLSARPDSLMGTAPVAPFCPVCSSVVNASVPPPYPNSSTMQLNQLPSLLGDSSASVFAGSMFSSGRQEVARGTSYSWPNLSGSNQVDDNGFNQLNALEAEPFSDLAEQFEIERQSYLAMYNARRGGENRGSDNDGGNGGGDSDGGNGGSDSDDGNVGSQSDGGNSSDNE